MKKNFLKFAVVAVMFAFAACSSDDGGSKNNNGGGDNNGGGTGDCASLKSAAQAAVASFLAGDMDCDTALSKVEDAWFDDCITDSEALGLGNQLPCFDINDYN